MIFSGYLKTFSKIYFNNHHRLTLYPFSYEHTSQPMDYQQLSEYGFQSRSYHSSLESMSRKPASFIEFSIETFVIFPFSPFSSLTLTRTRLGYIQQRSQNPRLKRIPNSVLIKKMPRIKHVHLKFEGDKALEFLELRKLGLFSKKAFKDAKSLTLEYTGKKVLKNEHIEILADHMNRGLRKLNHFSIKLEMERQQHINMTPLFKSLQQSFVSLVSLKLSLGKAFGLSRLECESLERLFAFIGSTLKHLDLDFSGNQFQKSSEALGMIILNRLHKLETLCLNFSQTKTSTKIVKFLIAGACTHLRCLSRLDINVEGCRIVEEDWLMQFISNLESNLRDLKLNLDGCKGLNLQFLSTLQSDIITLCPKLKRLFISTLNCPKFSNGFYEFLEQEFLQKLNLKWFRLLYSHDIEKNLERHEQMQALDLKQTMQMEEEVRNIKKWTRDDEEVGLFFKTLIEERQAPAEHELDEQEYLYDRFQKKFRRKEEIELEDQDQFDYVVQSFRGEVADTQECLTHDLFIEYGCDVCDNCRDIYEYYDEGRQRRDENAFQDRMETEIRFRDLTQGDKVRKIYLNYGESYDA